MQPGELDVVVLRDGRSGTVLDLYEDGKVMYIEFADKKGRTLSLEFINIDQVVEITYVHKEQYRP